MKRSGLWRLVGTMAGPGAMLCAVAASCEPQDIYLFDEVEEPTVPDAGGDDPVEPEPGPEPDVGAPAFEQPACETSGCDACVENRLCSLASTRWFCHPVTGTCHVPCDPQTPTGKRACPASQSCDTEIGLCVECVGSVDCSAGPLRACYVEQGVCVECVGPETCTTAEPYCDTTAHECVGCRDDFDCAATGQHCLIDEHRCVQCRDSTDCLASGDDNLCLPDTHVCRECVDSTDCIRIDPTRPTCSLENECEDD